MLASGSRVGRSHTPQDCCVRFAVVVAFHAATLATGRALPLTRTGLSPVGTRQLSWRTKGRHFEASLILQAVCWYLRYPLSYRDIVRLGLPRFGGRPEACCQRCCRCQEHAHRIRRSFAGKWSISSVLDAIPTILPASLSRAATPFARGSRRLTETRVAGRRRLLG